ncbi:hypothetical protein [Paenibacillus terrigena]|uniref:hypothetical protein n=1 Tax=Paenibacillus terrigena TaxID=369333 RepID=UPI0028D30C47|nr:hypothetical protein [Paenibacillus terrigena]
MKKLFISSVLLFFVMNQSVSASWAFQFVVYSGNTYEVTSEIISPNQIEKKIGQVSHYSDKEGTYSGNFSNTYPRGTKYYSVIGIDKNKEIAIKTEDNIYIKAIYQGPYDSKSLIYDLYFWIKTIFVICGLIIIYFIYKTIRYRPL